MNKRKLLLVALSLCMVAILAMGGTLAYLTDTDAQTNTFTVGHVALELDEGTIKTDVYDGRYLETDTETRTSDIQDYKVFPGDVVVKDPTIRLDSKSEYAWIAAKIEITCEKALDLLASEVDPTRLDITKVVEGNETGFITGGVAGNGGAKYVASYHGLANWHDTGKCYIYQDTSAYAEGKWTIYMYMAERQGAGVSITLFDTMHFSPLWTNEDMAKLDDLQIDITAYAVQEDGFVDCFTAMATAFAADFPKGDVEKAD